MAITKEKLSTSVNGTPVAVAATASPGTDIHVADAALKDEIELYAVNLHTAPVKLTVQLGGTATKDNITRVLDPDVPELIVPRALLTGGVTVKAFAGTTAVINIWGSVLRG